GPARPGRAALRRGPGVVTHATMFGRRVRLVLTLACLPLLGVGLAPGCGQGEGDRCEIDSDCSGDLLCDLSQGRSEGVCRSQIGTRPPDAGPDRPAPSPDTSVDRPTDSVNSGQ